MRRLTTLELEVTEDELRALAQFVHRIQPAQWRDIADTEVQARSMQRALDEVNRGLRRAGYYEERRASMDQYGNAE